ncbi:hypothetical protein B0H15DRAFT_771434, partial [Mycena belliarum]
VITVANNLTATNASAVFTPQVLTAPPGSTVLFNFTQGTHSATQSTFAAPCLPAHLANASLNGFDTALRPAGNGTSITTFILIMNPDIAGAPLWFFDAATCGIGGVGVINPGNVSATDETIDGFARNAVRLNGTGATSASSSAPTASATTGTGSGTSGGSGSGNSTGGNTGSAPPARVAPAPVLALAPLLLLGAALVL